MHFILFELCRFRRELLLRFLSGCSDEHRIQQFPIVEAVRIAHQKSENRLFDLILIELPELLIGGILRDMVTVRPIHQNQTVVVPPLIHQKRRQQRERHIDHKRFFQDFMDAFVSHFAPSCPVVLLSKMDFSS